MHRSRSVALCLLAAACGTSGGAGAGAPSGAASSAVTAPPAEPPAAPAPPDAPRVIAGAARSVAVSNDLFAFNYAYPAAAGSLPDVRLLLDADLAKTRAALAGEAAAGAATAKKDGFPYHAYETQVAWKVVTDLPDWLSLSAEVYTYSGGAHGMSSFETLLWDKRAGTRHAPIDLFVSRAALRAAVKAPFCAALDRERAKRRAGVPIGDAVPEFSRCIDPLDATLILGSSDRRAFTRIGLLIEPYSAGPYVEGTYEVTLPVTPAVLRAVKPKYAAAFAAR